MSTAVYRVTEKKCPGGVIMPHVVSPEVADGEVVAPPLVPGSQLVDVETVPLAEDQAHAGAKKS